MRWLLALLPVVALAAAPAAVPGYKETGSPNAPVTLEIYSDHMCPHCRAFYLETMPALMAEFVNTNRVRVIHRDYPLSYHRFSLLAARHANASGEIGRYDAVANQLFKTQLEWEMNGAIEQQVAKILMPAEMARVRELVKSDSRLDDTVAADVAMAARDGLTQTPTMIVVRKGRRESIAPIPPYSVLKTYRNEVLAKR